MRSRRLLGLLHFYPPFLGAGIRIRRMTEDLREIDVEMKLRWWNANYVGTHYGGSLYSMADPFYMLMLIDTLGRDYIVWDKSASIRFRKPGRGTVRAEFRLTPQRLDELRAQVDAQGKIEPTFTVQILDEQNEVVAEVEKLLHIRRKDAKPAPG
jgi:acyl-coenzyme A thioesterase PaaI-like protein